MRLNYLIRHCPHSERVLFGLTCEKSAVHPSPFANDTVEDEDRGSAMLSLDHVPDLSNSSSVGQAVS